MNATRPLTAALLALFVVSGSAHAGLLDKVKKAASKVGEATKSAASKVGAAAKSVGKSVAGAATSFAFSVKSITNAAIYGVEAFPKGVKTRDLLTPALEAQCPGIGARVNGCSVPLYDKITKQFKKLLEPACADHDICYNITDAKQACDTAFRDRMYEMCGKLSIKKTMGLCKVAAHTWFAAVSHSDAALKSFIEERQWSKATCKPVPELVTTKTIKKR